MLKSYLNASLAIMLTGLSPFTRAYCADLMTVYQQALQHDTIFQQAIATELANKEGLPIAVATLLPNISALGIPSYTYTSVTGTNFVPVVPAARAYAITLTATQTVFNFAQFATVAEQAAISKEAEATLNAALQNLMVRTTAAYLAILEDEDNVQTSVATEKAYAQEWHEMKTQYQVGQKTMTDVYTAQAALDASVATRIAAETQLADDEENLRVITGVHYTHLNKLSDAFPITVPAPQDINAWVNVAKQQNWAIKAAQYNVSAARQNIKQQFAGHLPTVSVQALLARTYNNDFNDDNIETGNSIQTNKQVALDVSIPLFAGGGVVAATNQARDKYDFAQAQLDQTILTTLNTTRQSYLGILAAKSQLQADKLGIKSSKSSLFGLKNSYNAGTETLVDILNQQQKVFQAETRYAIDRYQFINNIFALKQAAGTLSITDIKTLNGWLK